jgi:NADH dehydrogenase FAD-containing subunit
VWGAGRRLARPFQFLNLGILAYTGGSNALAQVQLDDKKVTDQSGAVGWLAWRSVYLAKQVQPAPAPARLRPPLHTAARRRRHSRRVLSACDARAGAGVAQEPGVCAL